MPCVPPEGRWSVRLHGQCTKGRAQGSDSALARQCHSGPITGVQHESPKFSVHARARLWPEARQTLGSQERGVVLEVPLEPLPAGKEVLGADPRGSTRIIKLDNPGLRGAPGEHRLHMTASQPGQVRTKLVGVW